MKNLEIMGVQEMDARELKKENGGWLNVVIFIGLLGLAAMYTIYRSNQLND